MKRIIITLGLLSLSLYFWSQSPLSIIVDGLSDDWKSEFRSIHKDNKITYSFTRDETNLYLCFRTQDGVTQQKIMRAGTIIQLSAKGDFKLKASIAFPLKSDIIQQQSLQGQRDPVQRERPDPNNRRQRQFEQLKNLKAKGFVSTNGIMDHSISNIKTALNWPAEGFLCYEVQIPLQEIFGTGISEEELNSPIQLKFTVNALSAPSGGTGDRSMSGGRGGGGGGRSGGGGGSPGGMRPGGQAGGMSEMTTSSIYKAEILINNSK